nr:hypothetical protein [Tanacetum cinerariifolium]
MLILDEFLTDDIRAAEEYKEYEKVFVRKKKRKQVAGETSSPGKSLKVTIRKKKTSSTSIPHPSDDRERDEIAEATILSLTLHKTALVDGEEEASYASEFANSVFQYDDDDFGNRIEPRSHKEHPETVDDDDPRMRKRRRR